MDWYPLYNSLRIALIATFFTFFLGIWAAWYVAKLPRWLKGVLDCLLTLPLVLPPTVVGFFLLKILGPRGPVGQILLEVWGQKLTMTWYASVFAVIVVTFPLMYRTVRGAFEAFDRSLLYAGKTLGRSNTWIFWRVLLPGCKQGLIAGTVLAFARGLGEYGATSMVSGYTPGRTATISTTVYQLWREGNDTLAYQWVLVNLAISLAVLLAINLLEQREKQVRWPVGDHEV
ncbi:MAG: molybdate ABC transporter permease subunit [Oscillospiraceae bacterium]|nr:molybdate ABC transporter permease subunit [Oscillospiraceae bacterium]